MSPPLGCYVLKDRDSVLLTSNSHNLVGCCLVTKLCLTLCDPVDCSPPCSSAHAISQARILEWVAIAFSRGSSQPRHQTHISCIGRWILYHWATSDALSKHNTSLYRNSLSQTPHNPTDIVVSDPRRPHGLQPSRLLHPWDFPDKSTGVGCHCLLRCSENDPTNQNYEISKQGAISQD